MDTFSTIYIDDFRGSGHSGLRSTHAQPHHSHPVLRVVGLPYIIGRNGGPANKLSMGMELRLSDENMAGIYSTLSRQISNSSCKKKDLDPISRNAPAHQQSHQTRKVFLHRLYTLQTRIHHFCEYYTVRLNTECRHRVVVPNASIASKVGQSVMLCMVRACY